MHPHLDLIEQLVHIFGWPVLIGALAWVIRKWDRGQDEFRQMRKDTTATLEKVTQMETNHLVHLQDGINRVAESNDKAVEALDGIKSGITILVDRTPRRRSRS